MCPPSTASSPGGHAQPGTARRAHLTASSPGGHAQPGTAGRALPHFTQPPFRVIVNLATQRHSLHSNFLICKCKQATFNYQPLNQINSHLKECQLHGYRGHVCGPGSVHLPFCSGGRQTYGCLWVIISRPPATLCMCVCEDTVGNHGLDTNRGGTDAHTNLYVTNTGVYSMS